MTKSGILPYPEIKSLNAPAKKLVIFLHGLGSDGHDLISLVPLIQPDMPFYHFISPHGVEAFDMAPFGRQWFSLLDRKPEVIIGKVKENIPMLARIIKEKQAQLNLTNQDTIIIGFSQGTMMGLYLNFIQEVPFAAVVGFSGRLIPPEECKNTSTNICIIHGEEDEMVEVGEMETIEKYLTRYKIKYESHKIPDLAHSIDARGIEFAVKFIKNL